MDEFMDWYQLELLRTILVEDPQTRKTHEERTYLIYDPLRNLWLDASGQSSAFRNDLRWPFTSGEKAKKEVLRLNEERSRNHRQETEGFKTWPDEGRIIKEI